MKISNNMLLQFKCHISGEGLMLTSYIYRIFPIAFVFSNTKTTQQFDV